MYINFLNVLTPKISVIRKNNHICKLQYTHLKIFGSLYPTFPYSPEQQSCKLACGDYWNYCCYYSFKMFRFSSCCQNETWKLGRIRMK